MRIGALLFVAIGLFTAAACNGPGADNEECVAQGGTCILGTDQAQCGEQLPTASGVCPATYVCCLLAPADGGTTTGTPPAADAGKTKS
jgi:hypothetical protein